MSTSIFWFRRDLRLRDNTSFAQCAQQSENILPIFILDPQFLDTCPENDKRLGFLHDALENLSTELKEHGGNPLNIFYGDPEQIIQKLCTEHSVSDIFCTTSLSQKGKQRDEKIAEIVQPENFHTVDDAVLVSPEKIETRKVFSAFYRQWEKIPKKVPQLSTPSFKSLSSPLSYPSVTQAFETHTSWAKSDLWNASKKTILDFFPSSFPKYDDTRNLLFDKDSTTKISPYTRFGIISPREVFFTVKDFPFDTVVYEKELAWREFWVHIQQRFPETQEIEFQEKRRHIKWMSDEEKLNAWKEGKTGYPVVDAAMRQLKQENWMHNRARMFTASFLTKNLHIDWREGEKYFAQMLIDYDEPINIGNWQWSSSVGADPKPLRIFSPVRQSERFDPDAIYIKKYVPELQDTPAKLIHDPIKNTLDYISPIVDAKEEAKEAKLRYMAMPQLF